MEMHKRKKGVEGVDATFRAPIRASVLGGPRGCWADAQARLEEDRADFAVDIAHGEDRAQRMARMPSCNTYVAMKGWGRNPKEVDKLGQQVPERYLA